MDGMIVEGYLFYFDTAMPSISAYAEKMLPPAYFAPRLSGFSPCRDIAFAARRLLASMAYSEAGGEAGWRGRYTAWLPFR